jgi:hypothetical protein
VAIVIAALTLSTSTAAMCRAAENLQPDAGRAFLSVLARAGAFLRPWLGIAIALFAATYAFEAFAGGVAAWARTASVTVLVVGATAAALPSSFHAVALVTQPGPAREAEATGSALAWRLGAAGRGVDAGDGAGDAGGARRRPGDGLRRAATGRGRCSWHRCRWRRR